MPAAAPHPPVDVRPGLSAEEFYAGYVNQRPVVVPGALEAMPAVSKWSLEYLGSLAPDLPVRLKTGSVKTGATVVERLGDYCATVVEWEQKSAAGEAAGPPPPYLHDVPLLSLLPGLRADLEPFPADFFPPFFGRSWWVFPQFFIGPSRSVTPLHFDTLLTHNLFFQLSGRKRFLMVDAADREKCYTYNWRWSAVDAADPDLTRYPAFRDVQVRICDVAGGDLLYMPPGTLHHVVSDTAAVSFNIDWHDRRSALRGLTAVREHMPLPNLRYNALLALGVWGGVPLKVLMPALRSYFTYIS